MGLCAKPTCGSVTGHFTRRPDGDVQVLCEQLIAAEWSELTNN